MSRAAFIILIIIFPFKNIYAFDNRFLFATNSIHGQINVKNSFHKYHSKKANGGEYFSHYFENVEILGVVLDKDQKNLIFYGYSKAYELNKRFYIEPKKLKYNSVFIGKYNIEKETFDNMTLLDNNSITTPNTLIMDHDGNFYLLYSLYVKSDKKNPINSAAQINLKTNKIKLVKLNSDLEKLSEKILEECNNCNLSAGGLVIDHENVIYSAILKNSSDFILRTENTMNDQHFAG